VCGCILLKFAQKHVKLLSAEVSKKRGKNFLVVELVLHLVLVFELVLVRLFEILGEDDVSVLSKKQMKSWRSTDFLPDGDHTSFLADRVNISTRDFVWSSDKVFEVDVVGQVHFAGNRREDKSLE
jgi:hypothetical protein